MIHNHYLKRRLSAYDYLFVLYDVDTEEPLFLLFSPYLKLYLKGYTLPTN